LSWYRNPNNSAENPAFCDGTIVSSSLIFPQRIRADKTQLLFGVLRALPAIVLREIYTLLSVFITNPNFKTNTAVKVVMSVVPEMLVTLILVFVGIQTRNIRKLRNLGKA
jgi:hypothetical protein